MKVFRTQVVISRPAHGAFSSERDYISAENMVRADAPEEAIEKARRAYAKCYGPEAVTVTIVGHAFVLRSRQGHTGLVGQPQGGMQ